jgi:hypothetical protein
VERGREIKSTITIKSRIQEIRNPKFEYRNKSEKGKTSKVEEKPA